MLFHYSLFFKFVNNFEISCQDNGFTLYNSILLMRADDFLSIINFGVSTAILNPVDVYRRWCKLSFTRMRDQVKHVIFLNRQARGDHIFTFYTNILGQLATNNLDTFLKTYLDLFLPFKRNRLDLEVHNSNLVQKIPN